MKAEYGPVVAALREAYKVVRDAPHHPNPAVDERIEVVLECILNAAEQIKRV